MLNSIIENINENRKTKVSNKAEIYNGEYRDNQKEKFLKKYSKLSKTQLKEVENKLELQSELCNKSLDFAENIIDPDSTTKRVVGKIGFVIGSAAVVVGALVLANSIPGLTEEIQASGHNVEQTTNLLGGLSTGFGSLVTLLGANMLGSVNAAKANYNNKKYAKINAKLEAINELSR